MSPNDSPAYPLCTHHHLRMVYHYIESLERVKEANDIFMGLHTGKEDWRSEVIGFRCQRSNAPTERFLGS